MCVKTPEKQCVDFHLYLLVLRTLIFEREVITSLRTTHGTTKCATFCCPQEAQFKLYRAIQRFCKNSHQFQYNGFFFVCLFFVGMVKSVVVCLKQIIYQLLAILINMLYNKIEVQDSVFTTYRSYSNITRWTQRRGILGPEVSVKIGSNQVLSYLSVHRLKHVLKQFRYSGFICSLCVQTMLLGK